MKRWIPALVLGAMVWGIAPAQAEGMGPDYDMRFELEYMPMRVSTSGPEGVCNSNMPVVQLKGEGKIFRGLLLGGSYAMGSGTNLNVVGVDANGIMDVINCKDPDYRDLELYLKIPFNFDAFIDSDRVGGPEPSLAPVYGYIGYKNTCLKANAPIDVQTYNKLNIESSSGVGFGLGCDFAFEPVGVYGQFVYYPSMITKNVGVDGSGDGKLYVFEWDAGVRTNFRESPVQARIGYHYEQHQARNIKLNYQGVEFAAVAQF